MPKIKLFSSLLADKKKKLDGSVIYFYFGRKFKRFLKEVDRAIKERRGIPKIDRSKIILSFLYREFHEFLGEYYAKDDFWY